MLRIRLLVVGKLKEPWLLDGCRDYIGRIRPFAKLEIVEIPDEAARDGLSLAQINGLIIKEGERVLKTVSPSAYMVLLDLAGKSMSSEELAAFIAKRGVEGDSLLEFVIGGSHGVSEGLRRRADYRLTFSRFTFPHQLMRLILLEQLYRSMKINSGHTYHK